MTGNMTNAFSRKKLPRIILRMILYGAVVVLALSLPPVFSYISPPRKVTGISPASYNLEFQDIILHTKDGVDLSGWFVPNKDSDKAVIVCHGYPMDKGDIFGGTAFLAGHYNLLFFDFRAMGKSSGRISTMGWREREDVLAAVRFLKAKGFTRIGAFGFSMGASAVLMANSPDIGCIVGDSSYAELDHILPRAFRGSGPLQNFSVAAAKACARIFFGADTGDIAPVKSISGMRIPILLIHCAGDRVIPADEARQLHRANPGSVLWLIPGCGHGESPASGEYEKIVTGFFNTHL